MKNHLSNHIPFLDQVFKNLSNLGIDTMPYELDHIAYRATTQESFKNVTAYLSVEGTRIHRKIIRNRFVDIYKLNKPLSYKDRNISFVELLSPAEGDTFVEGLEHVEFVVADHKLKEIVENHPSELWNLNGINREYNAEIGLLFENGANVKFHTTPISEVIRHED